MTLYLKTSGAILSILFICQACHKNNGIPATLTVSPEVDTIDGIVTITGTGFSTDPTKDIVEFNDSIVSQVLTATTTQLTVIVPFYTAKDRIIVKANGQQWQTAQEFEVVPKFAPLTEAPGYPITIMAGGSTTLSDYTVSFNGVAATPSGFIGPSLIVTVPGNAANGKITVNYKGQPYTSLTDFTISPVGEVTNLTTVGAFQLPTGMAFDNSGHLYVADVEGGVIDRVDPNSGAITPYAGNGTFSDDGGSPILAAGLYGALSLAFGPDGNLYAVDNWDNRVFKITADSITLALPLSGYSISSLDNPKGIVFDGAGNFYVGASQQIRMVSPGGVLSVVAGTGLQGENNGPAASATFGSPSALQFDGSGNLYICDGTSVRVLSNGIVSTFAGTGGNGGLQDGVGTNAGFVGTNDMVRDPKTGNFYVTDPGDHVVRMITAAGVVTTIAGTVGKQGTQYGTGPQALFEGPSGITMDKNGVLYVSDGSYSSSSIRRIVVH